MQGTLLPQERKVEAIKNGTVIDHVRAGRGTVLLKALHLLGSDAVMSVGLNFKSKAFGKKDIVKIEERELTPDELARIAIIAPGCTVNTIREYKVINKHCPMMPESISGLSNCPNPNCITNHEPMQTHFSMRKSDTVTKVRCRYCEKLFTIDDLSF